MVQKRAGERSVQFLVLDGDAAICLKTLRECGISSQLPQKKKRSSYPFK
jgi:hypothetical protein